ncbi:putative nepenthesin [Helianthus annuus]|uniref:protein ASPARTIC PROTEASE IN GUARD CELL 1-like n=1 Tax=Helianthus annuus TaxID=4232 RepID=UPI000B8F2468|nr:protein ASPARTIC PROTEASE IN GUARD CELL 1-like [Helianthus annuus]KAJ0913285.1 putative nepenthesin [Helianthus annuus]
MVSLLFFLFLSTFTRSISTTTAAATTTLDVASSTKKTLDVLNPALLQRQQVKTQNETTSSLSFIIRPRSSIHRDQHHHDYESLTLARLARDSHRVTSLLAKLNFAISGTNKSNSVYKVEDLTTPVTSGFSQGIGEYFARVGLGTPVQTYHLVIDTGSDITWLQCEQCFNCYQQTEPIYDPSGSSSYNVLPCTSQQCESLHPRNCLSNQCLYQVLYGDGSSTTGNFVTETISFGNSGSVPSVAIGCGHDNKGLAAAAGLLGLGGGQLSFPSQIKATSFSYCLVDFDSSRASTLEFNSAPAGNYVTVPLIRNPRITTFYYVGLTGILVGDQSLPIPPSIFAIDESGGGGAIVDSGTTFTHLPSQAYNALRDAFTQQAINLKPTVSSSELDTCFVFSSLTNTEVPVVAFTFAGGKTLSLKAGNFLIPVDSHGKFCLAFQPTMDSVTIIGNIQQQGTRVTYEMSKLVVSFLPDSC